MPAAALSPLSAGPAVGRRSAGRSAALAVRAAKRADGPVVAIVGVTGAVGQEFLRVRTGGGWRAAVCGVNSMRAYTGRVWDAQPAAPVTTWGWRAGG